MDVHDHGGDSSTGVRVPRGTGPTSVRVHRGAGPTGVHVHGGTSPMRVCGGAPVPPVSMFRGFRSHACPCPVSGRPLAGAPRHIPAPHRLLVPLGGSPRGGVCTPRGGGKGVKRDVVTLNPGVPQAQPQAGGSQEQRAACEQHSNYRKNTAVGVAACHLEGDSSRGAWKELTCL